MLSDQKLSTASTSGNGRRGRQRFWRAAGAVALAVAFGVTGSVTSAAPAYASGVCTSAPSGWRQVAISPDYGAYRLSIFRSPDNLRVMAKNIIRGATVHKTDGGFVETWAWHGASSLGSADFAIDVSWCSNSSPLPITTAGEVFDSHGNGSNLNYLSYGY